MTDGVDSPVDDETDGGSEAIGGDRSGRTDDRVRYDQARYVEDGQYEPLLSEKDLTRVEIGEDSPLPEELTRDSLEPEPLGARARAPLHPTLADGLRDRQRSLPARIVYDEVQPKIHRGRSCTAIGERPSRPLRAVGSGHPRGTVPATGVSRPDRRHGRRHAPATRRRGGEFVGIRVATAYHDHRARVTETR